MRLTSLALAGAIGTASFAAETLQVGDLTIHANAFVASALAPQVAERVGLRRNSNAGILNVTVVKGMPGSAGSSRLAHVEAQIVDPQSMRGPVAMREIRDGAAISYMGEFALPEPTTVVIEIRVRLAGSAEPQIVRLTQELFD